MHKREAQKAVKLINAGGSSSSHHEADDGVVDAEFEEVKDDDKR